MKVIWQLPVKQSSFSDHDWVHPKSKYHAFINNESVCGKYRQDTKYFETTMGEEELIDNKERACKKCLKKVEGTEID